MVHEGAFKFQAKERVKRTKENPKDCPKEPRVRTKDPKVPKAHAKVKPRKRVSQVLETETQESVQMGQVCITETSLIHEEWSPDERNNDWSLDVWNDEGRCVGWHDDCEQTYDTSASSFFLESSEWVKMNTGAAINTFPSW